MYSCVRAIVNCGTSLSNSSIYNDKTFILLDVFYVIYEWAGKTLRNTKTINEIKEILNLVTKIVSKRLLIYPVAYSIVLTVVGRRFKTSDTKIVQHWK